MDLSKYLVNGRLCWTLTSNGYKFLTWNFALHWQEVMKVPLLIICADRDAYTFFQREGVRSVLAEKVLEHYSGTNYGPQIVPFGSRQFSQLNRLKLRLLAEFAQRPEIQECVYLDGDIIVYKNFLEDIQQYYGDTYLLLQCDEQDKECSGPRECPNGCTGFVCFKHGIPPAVFKINDEAQWQRKPEDQVWVNYQLVSLGVQWVALPREKYPNGARVVLTHTNPDLKEKAFLLHYNYRVGNAKVYDIKRFRDWRLPY